MLKSLLSALTDTQNAPVIENKDMVIFASIVMKLAPTFSSFNACPSLPETVSMPNYRLIITKLCH